MANRRLTAAKKSVQSFFQAGGRQVVTSRGLAKVLRDHRHEWGIPESVTFRTFIAFLVQSCGFEVVRLAFPARATTRYLHGTPSVYQVALSVAPKGYFSHYTAAGILNLTDQIPRVVYTNTEQPPKRYGNSQLTQGRIDGAFRKSPRLSRSTADLGEYRICLLSGMHTGVAGVVTKEDADGAPIRVTNIERTLLDMTVRPFYAGGVFEVLNAYRRARQEVDVGALAGLLRQLRYTYPYHQAIGFYLESSGAYSRQEINLFREFPFDYDFYLTHQLADPDYIAKWRLYVPKGF